MTTHTSLDVLLVQVVVVKEPSERELEEAVMRFARVHKVVAAPRVLRVVHLVRVHRIKVGRVRRVVDLGHIGRLLRSQVLAKVNAAEEGMRLHLVRILAQTTIRSAAQLQDQVRRLRGELRLWRDAEGRLPVDHLEEDLINFSFY